MDGGVTGAPSMSSYSGSDDLSVEEGYYQLAVGSQTDALDQYRTSEVVLHQQQATLQSAQSASQAAVANVTDPEDQAVAGGIGGQRQSALGPGAGPAGPAPGRPAAGRHCRHSSEAQAKALLLAAPRPRLRAFPCRSTTARRAACAPTTSGSQLRPGSSAPGRPRRLPSGVPLRRARLSGTHRPGRCPAAPQYASSGPPAGPRFRRLISRRPRPSPSLGPRSASRTSGARPGRTPTTAPALP